MYLVPLIISISNPTSRWLDDVTGRTIPVTSVVEEFDVLSPNFWREMFFDSIDDLKHNIPIELIPLINITN